jgi:structural maintenance of chromosome 2
MDQRFQHLEKLNEYLNADLIEIDEKMNEIMSERSKNGGKFQVLEENFKEASKALVTIKTQLDLKVSSINDEVKNHSSLEKAQKDVRFYLKY